MGEVEKEGKARQALIDQFGVIPPSDLQSLPYAQPGDFIYVLNGDHTIFNGKESVFIGVTTRGWVKTCTHPDSTM